MMVFTVLVSRALLSSAVMLDADGPEGSYGLVMCSGSGPMFPDMAGAMNADPHVPDALSGMQMGDHGAMSGMVMPSAMSMVMSPTTSPVMSTTMSGMVMPNPAHADDTAPMPMGSMGSDKDNLCPFSAAFLTAIASVVFLSLFIGVIIANRSWSTTGITIAIRIVSHARPRARAPPIFA
jgi:hypothetical protein